MLDYSTLSLTRLVGQFQNSPKFKTLVSAITGVFTELETVANTLKTDRWIDTAVGVQLDYCGYIVNEPRLSRTDAEYRKAIKFRVFSNISKGTPTDLIRGLKFLTDPTDSQYLESYPATSILFTNGLEVDPKISQQMQVISPVGISTLSVAVSYAGKPFRFSKELPPGELFVNADADYLTANGDDIQVSERGASVNVESAFGGIVPAELDIGIGYLDIGGPTLAVYNPDSLTTLGHYNLTGVYQ